MVDFVRWELGRVIEKKVPSLRGTFCGGEYRDDAVAYEAGW